MLMLNQMVGFGVRSQAKYLIKVWAPGGGSGNWNGGAYNSGVGGSGSYAEAEFAASFLTGQTLIINVGQGGFKGPTGVAGTASGVPYLNGGESRTNPDFDSGGAGGGLCGVFLGSVSFANALIIAGSGGGAGGFGSPSGRPGGGGDRDAVRGSGYSGLKGTTSAGGAASSVNGNGGNSVAGSALTGGRGSWDVSGTNRSGGGGGAGYYGGGGGYQDGGGGGASFIHANSLSSLITAGTTGGLGDTSAIAAPNNSDPYYTGTIGRGSAYLNDGGNGRIVILRNGALVNTYDYTGSTTSLVI
jgi:hypothetical protein